MAYQQRWKKAPVVKVPRVHRQWSNYQQDIFTDISSGQGNTQVDALAGTGKTSTIVEGFYYIPRGVSTLMCAFNSSIQKELAARSPEGVEVKTLHSLGLSAVRSAFPKIKIDDKGEKLQGFIKAEKGEEPETYDLRESLSKAVSLCKGYLAETPQDIDPILDRHEIDTCGESREGFITSIIKVLNGTKKDTARCDFDDMIWLPNVLNMNMPKFGMVMIDEAQDLNLAQINLAINSLQPNGRVVSVGDEHQAIYGFRGADSNAIQNIVDRMQCKRMPLSVTYRCAKSIVELAQTLVPNLEYASGAEEGLVQELPSLQVEERIRPGDFLLSRTNAPLMRWCLDLLKAGIPSNIKGRDLGKNLLAWIRRSNCKDVNSLLDWLQEYKDMEMERLLKAKRDTSVLEDKVECLRTLCEGARTLEDVKMNIAKLFHDGDEKDRVILSTTHKAKGLERERVFMLKETYRPSKGTEEANLTYVAYTRAKKELYLVVGSK